MPTLKQLVEELKKQEIDPDDIRIPAQLYDDIIDDAENDTKENPEEE